MTRKCRPTSHTRKRSLQIHYQGIQRLCRYIHRQHEFLPLKVFLFLYQFFPSSFLLFPYFSSSLLTSFFDRLFHHAHKVRNKSIAVLSSNIAQQGGRACHSGSTAEFGSVPVRVVLMVVESERPHQICVSPWMSLV